VKESPLNKCHICWSLTEWQCEKCGSATCEDCSVKMTLHNQIDYCLCKSCGEYDARDYGDYVYDEPLKKSKPAILIPVYSSLEDAAFQISREINA
jgi:hypothetical protein